MADFLDEIQVASPCSVSWDAMRGDERVRHCDQCRLNVFNIAGMPRADALELVRKAEGRTCVRIFRRKDGTVLTADCPVGVRKLRRKVAMGLTGALAMLVAGATFATGAAPSDDAVPSTLTTRFESAKHSVRQYEPFKSLLDLIDPQPELDDLTMTAGVMMAPPKTKVIIRK
jgi:hypothetical protein